MHPVKIRRMWLKSRSLASLCCCDVHRNGERVENLCTEMAEKCEGRIVVVICRQGRQVELVHLWFDPTVAFHNYAIIWNPAEIMYITQDSLLEFKNWKFWYKTGMFMKKLCPSIEPPLNPFKGIPNSFPGVKKEYWKGIRARIAALRPKGPISTRFLANNDTILVIGDSVFMHGGFIEKHITYGLDRINREVKEWINGQRGRNSVVWLRKFSEGYNRDCESLDKVLGMIPGAKRMVMGHTIQSEGINGVCEGKALRIDVGISRGCGNGLPEVLEIVKGKQLRILTANPQYDERRNERRRAFEGKKEGLGMFEFEGRMKEVETKV